MERYNSLPSKRVLTEPFRVPLRAVEARAGFVELVLAFQGGGPGALQKACDLGLRKRLEGADGFEGLVEELLTVDAGDLHSDGQMQARLTATSASVGSMRRASGTFSMRTSPAPNMTVARMVSTSGR